MEGGKETGIWESKEDYTVLVSIKNKTVLGDEWKKVDILLIDEASLLSAQLLCEIDHVLCTESLMRKYTCVNLGAS